MRFLGGMAEAYQYSAKVQDTIFMASKDVYKRQGLWLLIGDFRIEGGNNTYHWDVSWPT